MKQKFINENNFQYEQLNKCIKKVKRNILYLGKNQWLTIFSYLNMKELAKCELVCQNWNYFIKSENIQLDKIFSYFEYDIEDYTTLKQQKTLIKKLKWFNFHIKFHNLKEFFYLNSGYENPLTFKVNKQLFIHLEKLIKNISKMSNLKKLHISFSEDFTNFSSLSTTIAKINNLETLTLILYDPVEQFFHLIKDLLKQSFSTLKSIQFINFTNIESSLLELVSVLNENCIETIVLCVQDIDSEIINKLEQFQEFKYFIGLGSEEDLLTYNQNLQEMIEKIGKKFEYLLINNLTDELTISIANHCSNLTIFQTKSEIKDGSIQYLLQKCERLKFLKVSGCKNLSAQCIPPYTGLRLIKAKDTKFTLEDKQFLESKLAYLQIKL